MTGLPAVSVLLDDGTLTYPIDVTALTRLPEALSWSRGRSDEHSDNQPGTLALAFDNTTSAFTYTGGSSLITGDSSTFEGGTAGSWAAVGGSSLSVGFTGYPPSLRNLIITWPTAGAGVAGASLIVAGLTVGVTYTLAASVFVSIANPDVQLAISGGALGPVVTTKGAWARTALTFTATATSHTVQILTATASTAAQLALLDLVQLFVGYAVQPDQGVRIALTWPDVDDVNLLTAIDADLETGTTGTWGSVGTPLPAKANDTTRARSGTHCLKITWAGFTSFPQVNASCAGLTIGQTYTFSAYCYVPAGSGDVRSDAAGVAGATYTAKDQWFRVSQTFVATGVTHAVGILAAANVIAGDLVFVDAAMVNLGAAPGEFSTVTARTTVNRWTGRLQGVPVDWPTGDDTLSLVRATATDALATAQRRTLYSAAQHEILKDSPTGYWQLSEESEFATQARDITLLLPALRATHQAGGAALKFGQDLGTPDGAKGVQFNSSAAGLADNLQATGSFGYTGTGFHLEATYNLSAALPASGSIDLVTGLENGVGVGSSFRLRLENGDILVVRGNGDAGYTVAVANASLVGVHTIALDTDAAASHLRFDDVIIDSRAGFAHSYDLTGSSFLEVGGSFSAPTGPTLSCVIGQVVMGAKLSDARTSVHQQAILFDLAGETPAARVTRVVGYTTLSVGTLDAAGDTILGAVNQAGRSALDVLLETGAADLGDLYADASGAISYVAGATIAGRAIPASFPAGWLAEDTQVVVDMFGVVNTATGTKVGGGNVYGPIANAASVAAHDVYRNDYSWNVNTDQQVVDRTNWQVGNYATPAPRAAQLVLDLLTMDPNTIAAALALDLTSFVRVTGLPAQTPGGTTLDTIVESITETISAGITGGAVWTLTLNVTQKALVSGWILGDATYGVLGTTTKLFV